MGPAQKKRTTKKAAPANAKAAQKKPTDTEPLRLEAERRFAKAEQDESKGLRRKQTRARRKTERADMKEELSQAKKKIEQLEQPGRGEHGEGK
ncbi:MAG TPA: hypothetical protein VK797_01630 [Tepidisphaeraceae bacterium]|jgi:hypothetical protein|nr:hypothetical protein [Tepidisphaeraceae bacterium]